MKKILIGLLLFFAFNMPLSAQSKEVRFIYINGSNNNTPKMKNWFYNGVSKLHPEMKAQFEKSAFSQKYFLENSTSKIADEPIPFFWGDKSLLELDRINSDLDITKLFSPKIAQTVRAGFAHCMHDAIWVQKYHNMHPVIQDLHSIVMQEYQKGNQVVLFGYSAGSFVTYQYLLNKLPNINLNDFFSKTLISNNEKEFVKNNPRNNTCLDAIIDSKLAVLSMEGYLVPNVAEEVFKNNYLKMNDFTQSACIPRNTVKGIVNFASPLPLFYSDITDPNYEFTYYNKLLYEYLIENNMFWLTVNYSEDPLGFPTTKNLSQEEIERIANIDIDPHSGFIFDKSNTKSHRTFLGAHTSYWSTAKHFSKTVVSAYKEGYLLYFPELNKF